MVSSREGKLVVGVVNGASHMLHFKHKLPKTASLVMLLVRRMHTSFTSQNRIPNLLDPRLFVRPKNTVATAKMVEAPPADMASSDSENMMEVEAPNNNSDGGAASGPPPRLMISKMVRFGPIMMMIRFDSIHSSVEFTDKFCAQRRAGSALQRCGWGGVVYSVASLIR